MLEQAACETIRHNHHRLSPHTFRYTCSLPRITSRGPQTILQLIKMSSISTVDGFSWNYLPRNDPSILKRGRCTKITEVCTYFLKTLRTWRERVNLQGENETNREASYELTEKTTRRNKRDCQAAEAWIHATSVVRHRLPNYRSWPVHDIFRYDTTLLR
jgi:hypothetical protein